MNEIPELTTFTAKLFKNLFNGNTFFSPHSIQLCCTMPTLGAEGQTKTELLNGLEIKGKIFNTINNLARERETQGEFDLCSSNGIWPQQGVQFNRDFEKTIREKFHAHFQVLDYNNPSEAANTINHKVEDHTKSRIKNLIDPNSLNEFTSLILTNAIYFKGSWENKFNKRTTCDRDFRGMSKTVSSPHMSQKSDFGYFENDICQAVMMPYKGKILYNLIILPKKINGLSELNLTGELLHDILSDASEQKVQITLPRYKLETEYKLIPTMQALGIQRAFTDDAEFPGITDETRMKISDIIHKAFVETDEDGTEAAAATAVTMRCSFAMPMLTDKVKEVTCDHPFFTAIYNSHTGNILFAGAVADM